MLIEIQRRLGHPIMDHFQWLAGTSTGAILALALAQGKTPAHCRDLYFRLKVTGSLSINLSQSFCLSLSLSVTVFVLLYFSMF